MELSGIYYADYLKKLEKELMDKIRLWRNGYFWDGRHFMRNPFSIINCRKQMAVKNYWNETGGQRFQPPVDKRLVARVFVWLRN